MSDKGKDTKMQLTETGENVLTASWNYKAYMTLGKATNALHENSRILLARILYRAKKELSNQGFRSDKKLYKNDTTSSQMRRSSMPIFTFEHFCEDIGMTKATAYRILESYNPDKDVLMSPEEVRTLKETIKKTAINQRYSEVHSKRTSGDPDWVPSDWTKLDEVMYEQWLVENGYKKAPDVSLIQPEPPIINKYGQYGLFSDEYLNSLSARLHEETQGDNAIKFSNLCDKYKSSVPKGIQPRDVVKIPLMVKAALEGLPREARQESKKLVAEIILAEEI